MYRVACVFVLVFWAGIAQAADKPLFGPAPSWVKPAKIALSSARKDSEASLQRLLFDVEVNYAADGTEIYREFPLRFGTPAGLSAGNIAVDWQPDIETLTIHYVHIIRDGHVIDVLASGQTFTVLRRETDLERAMLNGVLTASLQPEGLQVGDTLDYAYTIKRSDPVMQGYAEFATGPRSDIEIDHLRMRELWPNSKPMRWREGSSLPAAKLTKTSDGAELVVDAMNFDRPKPPNGAPGRYERSGYLSVSQFASWAEVSALMAPLYDKASSLPPDSPLNAEIAKIRGASADPKVRAAAALHLVQDKVRYLFLGMNEGGLVPAEADTTWARRFGDCKGKTALLLALLRGLGIEAEPAMVSTTAGDGIDEELPLVSHFDHILVRARIGGKTYWLDGARVGDLDLDRIQIPPYHWALPVQATGADLDRLDTPPPPAPLTEMRGRLDASAGLDARAPVHFDMIVRGDAATVLKLGVAQQSKAQIKTMMQRLAAQTNNAVDPDSLTFAVDDAAGEGRISLDGAGGAGWPVDTDTGLRTLAIDAAGLGGAVDYTREKGPDQNAPFAVAYPYYAKTVLSVVLPQGGKGFSIGGDDVDKVIAGVEYKRTARIEGDVFTVESSTRSLASEFPASEAPAAKIALRDLAANVVKLRAPKGYMLTDQENRIRLDRKPVTAGDFADQGEARIWAGQYAGGMADYDKAVALKPDDAPMLNARCFARAEAGKDLDAALADCNASLATDPNNAATLDSRGFVYFRMGQLDKALADDDAALKLFPRQTQTLYIHGLIERRKGDTTAGDADVAAATAIDPTVVATYAHYGVER